MTDGCRPVLNVFVCVCVYVLVLWIIMLQVWVLHILALQRIFTDPQLLNILTDTEWCQNTEKQKCILLYVRSTSTCWRKGCALSFLAHQRSQVTGWRPPPAIWAFTWDKPPLSASLAGGDPGPQHDCSYMSSNIDQVQSIISARVLRVQATFHPQCKTLSQVDFLLFRFSGR